MGRIMASNFRIPSKNNVIASDLPATGAGSQPGDPVVTGDLVGANLWGTGQGQGVPAGSTYGMVALDGVIVTEVELGAAVTENQAVYISAGNELSDDDAGTLFGYTDEPSAAGTVRIGVRISNAVGA